MMRGWTRHVILAGVVLAATPAGLRATLPDRAHDFHVSYTRIAVEPTVVSAQLRLFADDVTRALIERSPARSLTLGSPQGEAAFQAYLAEYFPVTANGKRLTPIVVSGSQDRDMWSYIVTWTSATPITSLSLHNAALMELFDDQQNIVKVKVIATGQEQTLFYSGGSRVDQVVRF